MGREVGGMAGAEREQAGPEAKATRGGGDGAGAAGDGGRKATGERDAVLGRERRGKRKEEKKRKSGREKKKMGEGILHQKKEVEG